MYTEFLRNLKIKQIMVTDALSVSDKKTDFECLGGTEEFPAMLVGAATN